MNKEADQFILSDDDVLVFESPPSTQSLSNPRNPPAEPVEPNHRAEINTGRLRLQCDALVNHAILRYEEWLVDAVVSVDDLETGDRVIVKNTKATLLKDLERELLRIDLVKQVQWERQREQRRNSARTTDSNTVDTGETTCILDTTLLITACYSEIPAEKLQYFRPRDFHLCPPYWCTLGSL